MLISSDGPLTRIVLRVTTLAPMRAQVQVGRDRQTLHVEPGSGTLASFAPGPGKSWGGERFYHLNVTPHGGVTRTAIGQGADIRELGVHLEVVQTETSAP